MNHWEENHHRNLGIPGATKDCVPFGVRGGIMNIFCQGKEEGGTRWAKDACRSQGSVLLLALNDPSPQGHCFL